MYSREPHSIERSAGISVDPERYDEIDRQNRSSFYLNESHTLRVVTSVSGQETKRHLSERFAGNMSEAWGRKDLPDDERIGQARENVDRFVRQLGVDPSNVWILTPQRDYTVPLRVLDVDEYTHDSSSAQPLPERADMLVTSRPETVLAVRPADCPVIVGYGFTKEGERLTTMTHIAHGGAAAGFVEQSYERTLAFGIEPESLRYYVTAGAQAENFPYVSSSHPLDGTIGLERLFVNIKNVVDESGKRYEYRIDTPNFVYRELLRLGVDPYQIFMDTSDTARPDSHYSSHGRAARSLQAWYEAGSPEDGNYEIGQRDIVLARQEER